MGQGLVHFPVWTCRKPLMGFDPKPTNQFTSLRGDVWTAYTFSLGFLVVFRNNQAYNRFWKGSYEKDQVIQGHRDHLTSNCTLIGGHKSALFFKVTTNHPLKGSLLESPGEETFFRFCCCYFFLFWKTLEQLKGTRWKKRVWGNYCRSNQIWRFLRYFCETSRAHRHF